jgi:outer membrane immunogenic protein
MKKVLLGTQALVASSLLALPAIAADMPLAMAPAAAPVQTWTGWYIGINGGEYDTRDGTVNMTGTDTGAGGLGSALAAGTIPAQIGVTNAGWMVGGTAGFNWQINPLWVIGIEGDLDGGKSKQFTSASPAGILTTNVTRELDDLGTLRGRLGMTVVQPLLIYGTGGLAVTDRKFTLNAIDPGAAPPLGATSSLTGLVAGWTVGFGLEYTFGPHWSFKGDYLYASFGSPRTSIAYAYGANTSSLTATARDSENIVRAGINYRF